MLSAVFRPCCQLEKLVSRGKTTTLGRPSLISTWGGGGAADGTFQHDVQHGVGQGRVIGIVVNREEEDERRHL